MLLDLLVRKDLQVSMVHRDLKDQRARKDLKDPQALTARMVPMAHKDPQVH